MKPEDRNERIKVRIEQTQRKAENERIAHELNNGRSACDIEVKGN